MCLGKRIDMCETIIPICKYRPRLFQKINPDLNGEQYKIFMETQILTQSHQYDTMKLLFFAYPCFTIPVLSTQNLIKIA